MPRWMFSWILVAAVAVLVTWQSAKSETAHEEEAELYRLFVDALEHVDRSYVKEVDRREMIQAAIEGMLERLDPYSNFIPPTEYEQFNRSTTGKFGGIGIQVRPKATTDADLVVMSPVVGTPAYEAGVLAEDRITHVNGDPIEGLSQNEVVELLTGEPGTDVKITVLHAPYNQPPVDITITRAVINIESVRGDEHTPDNNWNYMIDPESKIGYIRISSFMQNTSTELKEVLEKLSANGARGLILDLRDNPGGLLNAATEVCDLFLKEGVIVSVTGRNTREKKYTAAADILLPDVPMAVLVNRWSASASEIVSACLQDHDRAVVVGERSFGKGSVQNVIQLEGGKSALKLTTASYLRPSGKNIHRFKDSKEEDDWGVRPNDGYEVKLSDKEHQQYNLWRHERDRIIGKGQSPAPEEEAPAAEPDEAPKADPTEEEPESTEPGAEGEADEENLDEAPQNFDDRQLDKALEYIREHLNA